MTTHTSNFNFDRVKNIQNEINEKILKRLNKSVIFSDNQFMEWFNLTIGVDKLIKSSGAYNIKEFSSFENGGDQQKAVFLLSQPLTGLVVETLRDIITTSKFQYIVIITNLSPLVYGESVDYFDSIKDNCLIWMNDANNSCDIYYEKFPFTIFPNHNSQNSNTLFFLNPLSSWSCTISLENFNQVVSLDTYQHLIKQETNELHTLANSSVANTKDHFSQYYHNLNQLELNELKSLVNSINETLDQLDAKDDVFTFGILSALVANELNLSNASKQRKKTGTNKVSLLLIDRNLDLCTTSLYHEETVMDKINNLLPNLSTTSNDVKIDLRNYLFGNNFKSMLPGNFYHLSNDSCRLLTEQFLVSKPKECLLDVYRKLCEVFPLGEKDKKSVRINSDTLKNQIINGIKNNKKLFYDYVDLIQIVSAYCQINDPQLNKQIEFDKLISYVKVLNQNILDKDGPSVLSRVYALFSEKIERSDQIKNMASFSVSDLIILLIYVYSLIGEECYYGIEEEHRLKNLLIDELESDSFENDSRFKFDLEFFAKIKGKSETYSQFVEKFFQNLKSLRMFRKNSKQYYKLMIKDEERNHYTFKPLIKQVCENLTRTNVSNSSEPLVDIEYRPSSAGNDGIGNLFKSFKIGYLMNSNANKMHPLNNDVLIIYFIGGITSYEFKIVRDIFNNKEHNLSKKVLIGSSHFYNQYKLIRYLFN